MSRRIERFRDRLEKEQRTILVTIEKTHPGNCEAGGLILDGADDGDIAAEAHQTGLALILHDSGTTRLKAIKQALKRLGTEEWGRCAECKGEIPVARLEAVPWATLCVNCQDESEHRNEAEKTQIQTRTGH